MNRRACILASVVGLLAGCGGLPDLRRAQVEMQAGDIAAAERDLVPLAEHGYLAAQTKLADLYSQLETPAALKAAAYWYRTAVKKDPSVAVPLARVLVRIGSPEELAQAEQFLRAADGRGDPRALAALIELYTDYPERDPGRTVVAMVDRAEKINARETESALIRWYRRNAAEPRYTTVLIRRCNAAKDRLPECYVDLVRYNRSHGAHDDLRKLCTTAPKRYSAGQMPATILERVAWSLVAENVSGDPQPDVAYGMLKRIDDPSPEVRIKLARLLVEYPHLDPGGDPEALLQSALAQGSPEAALALGRLYMKGERVPANPADAERYLKQAASTLPAAHYFLGRLYKRGDLGAADPVRAAQHLLTAGRSGYVTADYALALLFSDNRGVRVNRVNALVFASLAARNAVPEGEQLLNQLTASASVAELQNANRVLQQELAVRGAQPEPAGSQGEQPRSEDSP